MGNELSTQDQAKQFVASGYFKSSLGNDSQALVKMQYAIDLGVPVTAAMSGINIINGKPQLSSAILAALVKASDKYTYIVKEKTDKTCIIEFYEIWNSKKELIGIETYNIDMASRAGLLKLDPWKKYPEAMLFARCISAGMRTHAPDVTMQAVYSEGELEESREVDITNQSYEENIEAMEITEIDADDLRKGAEESLASDPNTLTTARTMFRAMDALSRFLTIDKLSKLGYDLAALADNEQARLAIIGICETLPKCMLHMESYALDFSSNEVKAVASRILDEIDAQKEHFDKLQGLEIRLKQVGDKTLVTGDTLKAIYKRLCS